MEFDYDPAKSQINKEKHGIDFEAAKSLWADEDRIEFPARSETESRFALLARMDGKIWAAFFTVRGDTTRIISVRRARPNEETRYHDI